MEENMKEKEKLIKENRIDIITNLLLMLDIDEVRVFYPNKNNLTSEKTFRKNICELINYMYELASKLNIAESNAKLYEKFYNQRLKNSILISEIEEKIKDLKENDNGDDYSLINVINILQELSKNKTE